MKKFWIIVLTALCCVAMAACSGGKTPENPTVPDSVLLADSEVTVYVGGTYKFEPSGAAAFTYSSSDENVAKVTSDGVLTGISDGTTFVTVSAGSGEASATCRVNVIKSETYIRLGSGNRNVVAGSDITIKAEAIRNGEVTDEKVEFTVDKPEGVTIVESGVNEITATIAEAGSYVITATAGSISAKCNVKAVNKTAKTLAKPGLTVDNCATLTWGAVEGAVGYVVAVNGGAETTISETSYDVSDVTDGLEFGDKAVFSVRAVAAAADYEHIDGAISTLDFSHDYKETIVSEHTCVQAGVSDFECATCGKKYTDENRLDDHIYTNKETPRGTGACLVCGFQRTKKVNYKYDEHNDCYFVAGVDGGYDSKDLYILAKYNDGTPEHGEKPVKYIAFGAFKNNKIIVRAFLPQSMTEFTDKDPAFVRSNGKSLNDDVEGMGGKSSPLRGSVFEACENLELVSMPGVFTLPAVAEGSYAHWNFRDCYNLTTVIVPTGFENRGAAFMRWTNTPSKAESKTDIYVNGEYVTRVCDAASYPINGDVGYGNNKLLTGDVFTYDKKATTETCFKWRYADDGVTIISGGKHEFNGKNVCRKCGARNAYGVTYGYDSSFVNADGSVGAYYVGDNRNLAEPEVVILAEYDDGINGAHPVSFVKNAAFADNGFVKKVVLPSSVIRLDGLAFKGCGNLEHVELPGVVDLGYKKITNGIYSEKPAHTDNNFLNCYKLKKAVVNPNVKMNCGQFKGQQIDDPKHKGKKIDPTPITELYSTAEYVDSKMLITAFDSNNLMTGSIYYYDNSRTLDSCLMWMYDDGEIVQSKSKHEFDDNDICTVCGAKNNKDVIYKPVKDENENITGYYVGGYVGFTGTVEIQKEWYGKSVTYVEANAFEDNTNVKKVIMPYINDLGGNAFKGCYNLEYVDMRGVTYISYANKDGNGVAKRPDGSVDSNNNFLSCFGLKTVIVGDGYSAETQQFVSTDNKVRLVANMYVNGTTAPTLNGNNALIRDIYYLGNGEKCFTWCEKDGAFKSGPRHTYGTDGKCTVCQADSGVEYAYDSANQTYYVKGLKTGVTVQEVVIVEKYNDGTNGEHPVTYVANRAFAEKSFIRRVIMPSVTDLGGMAFFNCQNLEYVDMRGVTYISYWNKDENGNAKRPDGLVESNNNFLNCFNLKTVIVGSGYHAEAQQFVSTDSGQVNRADLYVYGAAAPTKADNDKLLTDKIYYYNATKTDNENIWRYVDGIALCWVI